MVPQNVLAADAGLLAGIASLCGLFRAKGLRREHVLEAPFTGHPVALPRLAQWLANSKVRRGP